MQNYLLERFYLSGSDIALGVMPSEITFLLLFLLPLLFFDLLSEDQIFMGLNLVGFVCCNIMILLFSLKLLIKLYVLLLLQSFVLNLFFILLIFSLHLSLVLVSQKTLDFPLSFYTVIYTI